MSATSIDITSLIGAYSLRDFKSYGDDAGDDGPIIQRALNVIASNPTPGGILWVPPGTYRINTMPSVPSSVQIWGAGSVSVFKLGPAALVDVLKLDGVSNVTIRNIRIDGNRANNSGGTRNGLWLSGCTDVILDHVDVTGARGDGVRMENCERVELTGCSAHDNGRHGFSLSFAQFCQMIAPRGYDNCQVSTAGDGDGINVETFSQHNVIIAPVCYATSRTGGPQGYGIREVESSQLNQIIGGIFQGNLTAPVLIGGRDSVWISQASAQLATLTQYTP